MIMQNLSHRTIETIRQVNTHMCPECCMRMKETETSKEGDYVFLWYECLREDCTGQWLEKKKIAFEKCSA